MPGPDARKRKAAPPSQKENGAGDEDDTEAHQQLPESRISISYVGTQAKERKGQWAFQVDATGAMAPWQVLELASCACFWEVVVTFYFWTLRI